MSDRIQINIYSHDGHYIDKLFDSENEFEGQAFGPQVTLNANGQKDLSLSLPLRILSKDRSHYIDNPRWDYITKQYKVRVVDNNGINEYVLRTYDEIHSEEDQITINATFMSLAEFELSQVGYELEFNENTLYMYASNQDPNDPDNAPIGTYNSDIHFWEKKVLEKVPSWNYRVESYYEVDTTMVQDNRQITDPTSEMKTGKEQFYEDSRIITYDDNNNPIKSEKYDIKQRILKAEKSSIWNIQQDICEKFKCWPDFEILYNENETIKSKTIVLRNDLPQDALFSIDYAKNLKSIQRTVDNSQVVTKMFVSNLENENVNEGIVTIATNEKNFMKENYLLDFSWYLGENNTDSELKPLNLINPNLSLTFKASQYATPELKEVTINKTKNIIEQHKKYIRYRNIYIENKSLELTKAKKELIDLKSELLFKQSSKEAAQEAYNKAKEEWALCPEGTLTAEDRKCFIYNEDGVMIVKFSEKGVRVGDIPHEGFNKPINLILIKDNEEIPITEDNVNEIDWTPYEYEPIVGTVTKMQVTNVKFGDKETYGCFSCNLDYSPLEFYNKLKAHWFAKIKEYEERLKELGKPKDEGGIEGLIPELEKKVENLKAELYNAQKEKRQAINEFEALLFPYVREGYWEDTDYGIYSNKPFETGKMMPTEKPFYNEIMNKEDWSKKYFCYFIPNKKICTYKTEIEEVIHDSDGNPQIITRIEEKDLGLYDIIDIDTVEIMSGNPATANTNGQFKCFVKGTDYQVQFGYTTYDVENESQYKRGIYVTFFQKEDSLFSGAGTNKDTELFIRAKSRSGSTYIFETEENKLIKPEFDSNRGGRPYFSTLTRTLTLDTEDIILSSIKVDFSTGLVKYNPANKYAEATQIKIPLEYGRDYETHKEFDDETQKVLTIVTLHDTVNCPLRTEEFLTETPSWFILTYEQDVTNKFYYNDALEVMKTSCLPQVSYNINVLDISNVLNPNLKVENFKPKVGTKVPIYDKELNFNGLIGFISSITYDLLEPANTNLVITNFKDKFEDLFQKITAATVTMESKEYTFDKATEITNEKGEIKVDLLMNSLLQNNMALALSPNNDVVWDNSGITVTNKDLNANGIFGKLRITSNGIFIANRYDEFGNYAWTTAVTPDFINADAITVGKLDTRQIQIWNSTEPRFVWNETGLYAYGEDEKGYTDFDTFVVYNHKGLKFRELAPYQGEVTLKNLFTTKLISSYTNWQYTADTKRTTGRDLLVARDYVRVAATALNPTNTLEAHIPSETFKVITLPLILKGRKYYYSIKARFNNIPETAILDFYGGFSGKYKELTYDKMEIKTTSDGKTNSGWYQISGFVDNIDNTGKFGIIAAMSELNTEWSIDFADPIIIDITNVFGESVPQQKFLDNLDYFYGTSTVPFKDFKIYQTAVSLGWNGLTIGAQDDVLQLTSTDGLVVYEALSNPKEKQLKLQLGTWVDDDGIRKYGLRGLKDSHTVFEISQDGALFNYKQGSNELGTLSDAVINLAVTRDNLQTGLKDGTSLSLNSDMVKIAWNSINQFWTFDKGHLILYYNTDRKIFDFNDNYLDFYDGSSNNYELARFDRRNWIFYKGLSDSTVDYKVCSIGQDYFRIYDGTVNSRLLSKFDNTGIYFYKYGSSNIILSQFTSNGIQLNNSSGSKRLTIQSSGIDMWYSDKILATYGASGVQLNDINGNKKVTVKTEGLTIHKTGGEEATVVDSNGIHFWAREDIAKNRVGAIVANIFTDTTKFGMTIGCEFETDFIGFGRKLISEDPRGYAGFAVYYNKDQGPEETDWKKGDFKIFPNRTILMNKTIVANNFEFQPNMNIDSYSEIDMHGYGIANSSFISDGRLKTNIKSSKINALTNIKQMNFRQFVWKEDNKQETIGLIAQEVAKIDSTYVNHDLKYDNKGNVIEDIYFLEVVPLLSTALKGIQEQQEIIEKQNETIENLKNIINIIAEKTNIIIENNLSTPFKATSVKLNEIEEEIVFPGEITRIIPEKLLNNDFFV